jgi:hypothetical protein
VSRLATEWPPNGHQNGGTRRARKGLFTGHAGHSSRRASPAVFWCDRVRAKTAPGSGCQLCSMRRTAFAQSAGRRERRSGSSEIVAGETDRGPRRLPLSNPGCRLPGCGGEAHGCSPVPAGRIKRVGAPFAYPPASVADAQRRAVGQGRLNRSKRCRNTWFRRFDDRTGTRNFWEPEKDVTL